MDFSNRSTQPQPVAPSAHPVGGAASANKKSVKQDEGSKWARIGVVVAVLLVAIIIAGVALVAGSSNTDKSEASYVDSTKLQAVFLNTGQVYFGNVTTLNNKFFVVKNIYYLQTASTGTDAKAAANSSVSLVKLGCELHEPYDKMVINRDQVTFWENLQDGGQVAKAVATFEKANPSGQKCTDQSNSSSNTSNAVQSAGTAATKP